MLPPSWTSVLFPGCVPGLPEGLCAQQGLFLPLPLGCLRTAPLLCLAHGHAW